MSPLEASDALHAWRSAQPGLRSTSFPLLDTVSDGLVPGRVWLITSTPGHGRSTLAIQWALLLTTSHGVRTDLVSAREPVRLVAARLLSAAGKIPVSHLWADETTTACPRGGLAPRARSRALRAAPRAAAARRCRVPVFRRGGPLAAGDVRHCRRAPATPTLCRGFLPSEWMEKMPRYLTSIHTAWSPTEAFGFMADVRNFVRWDPGVESVSVVAGDGPGPDASYDVVVRAGPRRLVLRYVVVEWEAPHRLLLVAETRTLRSVDEIRVQPADGGALVTYDAKLDLRGVLSWGNPLLGLVFRRVGDRAASGLRRALDGEPWVSP